MTERPLQPGDRVEWRSGTRTVYGTVERIGTGKDEGLAMVLRDNAARSEVRQVKHLTRSTKTRTAWPMRGDGVA